MMLRSAQMECLISDILKQILGLCDISSLFCLQFVNKNIGNTARKSMRIISKSKQYSASTDVHCEHTESIGRRYYLGKQVEIANGLAQCGIKMSKWLHNLLPKWPLPEYCYATDVETLELIHSNTKNEHCLTGRIGHCPSRELLEWMILTAKPRILAFDINELVINKHYDLLEKIPINDHFIDSDNYELLCWMIDNNIPIYNIWGILPFLAGGGKRHIISITMSSDGPADVSNFKCQNVGVYRVKQIVEIGYNKVFREGSLTRERISNDVFVAAVEANNIELLDYLHEKVTYTSLIHADVNMLFHIALVENNYEVIKWILEHYDINRQTKLLCSDIKILLFLKDNGFIWDSTVYFNAVKTHDLNLIKYFHENNVPWESNHILTMPYIWRPSYINEHISECIAAYGNVEILQWAILNGCPLSSKCNIYSSNVSMIKYLTLLGYPPVSRTVQSVQNDLDAVKLLCRSGVIFDDEDIHYSSCYGSSDVEYWLIKHMNEIKINTTSY